MTMGTLDPLFSHVCFLWGTSLAMLWVGRQDQVLLTVITIFNQYIIHKQGLIKNIFNIIIIFPANILYNCFKYVSKSIKGP